MPAFTSAISRAAQALEALRYALSIDDARVTAVAASRLRMALASAELEYRRIDLSDLGAGDLVRDFLQRIHAGLATAPPTLHDLPAIRALLDRLAAPRS